MTTIKESVHALAEFYIKNNYSRRDMHTAISNAYHPSVADDNEDFRTEYPTPFDLYKAVNEEIDRMFDQALYAE